MNLPMYAIVGECPVKILPTADGGMQVLFFDWDTKDFAPDDGHFLQQVMLGHGDVDYLSEADFEAHVAKLKASE
jgi:hypothetical protein